MKTLCLVTVAAVVLSSCGKEEPGKSGSGGAGAGKGGKEESSFVSATIDGQPWRSDDVRVILAETNDRFSIHTTDNGGKKDLLLDMAPYSKTKAGAYSSEKQQRNGISLLDTDKADGVEFDYDNYLERESPDCIRITSIKDLEGKKQLIEGTFQSEMVPSFNAAGKKTIQITDGKFKVIFDTVANTQP